MVSSTSSPSRSARTTRPVTTSTPSGRSVGALLLVGQHDEPARDRTEQPALVRRSGGTEDADPPARGLVAVAERAGATRSPHSSASPSTAGSASRSPVARTTAAAVEHRPVGGGEAHAAAVHRLDESTRCSRTSTVS